MFEKCIYFAINAMARKINKLWEAEFKTIGLSPAHGYMLTLILEKPGLRQKEIAETLCLDPSTITRFIDALIDKGYITRQNDEDGRASKVVPTAKGKNMKPKLETVKENLKKQAADSIGLDVLENMRNAIGKCDKEMAQKQEKTCG